MINGKFRIKIGIILMILFLLPSAALSGCNKGKGEEEGKTEDTAEEASEEAAQNDPGFAFEGTENNGDSLYGLTSEEVLNAPVGDENNKNGVTANIPSNINVERGTTAPVFDPSSISAQSVTATPTPRPSTQPATATGIGINPQTLTIYTNPSAAYTAQTNNSSSGRSGSSSTAGGGSSNSSSGSSTSPSTSAITAGSSNKLTATLYGGSGDIFWSSSDTNVAQVNGNGLTATVDGKSSGTAVITASVLGSDLYATAVVNVFESTPTYFPVGDCMINQGGDYSASGADKVIAEVNKARAAYNIPACAKNTSLCKVADVRAKEVSYVFMNLRPDGSAFTTVAPQYYMAECIAYLPKTASATEAVTGLNNYTTTRKDIMNEDYRSLGASYYTWGDLTYVVLAFGY